MERPEDLPGVKKKSFSMFYGGGEIWFEHLDGIYRYTEIALNKLEKDFLEFKRPSSPGLIAINLDETTVDKRLIESIADKLLCEEKQFTRVVFVGVKKLNRSKFKKALVNAPFTYNFIDDFEKAKSWLVHNQ